MSEPDIIPAAATPPATATRILLAQTACLGPATVSPLPASSAGAEDEDAPSLSGTEIWATLANLGLLGPRPPAERYRVDGLLGAGSSGTVYGVTDRSLGRQLAVKLLNRDATSAADSLSHFIEEAQLTAGLRHPNVLPVVDIGVTHAGRPYFSMTRLEGRTLGDLIARSTPAIREAAIVQANSVVSIYIAVCNAVAYAHHQRIIHQDIKPDNILIGSFGEVVVLDWGSAARLPPDGQVTATYGTPLYMSPEQARAEQVDELSDCYCLGASLFHTLTLRLPTWSDEIAEFMRKKRSGTIDPLTADERERSPVELLEIASKAMAASPADRYQGIEAMRDDLLRYQAGQAVSAHRYTLLQSLRRWYRCHRWAVWTWGGVAAIMVSLLALLYGQTLKQVASWGRPVVVEDFRDQSWTRDWQVIEGSFVTRNGSLVTTGASASILMYRHRLVGPTAIEYDGEILPGSLPCDISMAWSRGTANVGTGRHPLIAPLYIKLGAFNNSYSSIETDDALLAYNAFRPVVGRRYRIRVELVDNSVDLSVDGRSLCHYVHPFPLTNGYLSLFGFYPDKAFSHIRIFSRGEPRLIAPTAIGDALVEEGFYDKAADRFARVVASHPGSALAEEALYKQGLCASLAGDQPRAFAVWSGLHSATFLNQVSLHRLASLYAAGDFDHFLSELDTQYRNASVSSRQRIAIVWTEKATDLRNKRDLVHSAAFLALHDRMLDDQPVTSMAAAELLILLGRPQEVLHRYPDLRWQDAQALLELGRTSEVIDQYPEFPDLGVTAACLEGRYDLLHSRYGDREVSWSLIDQGRIAEFMQRHPDDSDNIARCLLLLGRIDELQRRFPTFGWTYTALILMGRLHELPPHYSSDDLLIATGQFDACVEPNVHRGTAILAGLCRTFEAVCAGDASAMRRLLATTDLSIYSDQIENLLMLARFAADTIDHGDSLGAGCAAILADQHMRYRAVQRVWYMASFLTHRIDEAAFLAQPYQPFRPADLELMEGIRDERDHQPASALIHWRRWQALAPWQRSDHVDPFRDHLVAWRIAALSR